MTVYRSKHRVVEMVLNLSHLSIDARKSHKHKKSHNHDEDDRREDVKKDEGSDKESDEESGEESGEEESFVPQRGMYQVMKGMPPQCENLATDKKAAWKKSERRGRKYIHTLRGRQLNCLRNMAKFEGKLHPEVGDPDKYADLIKDVKADKKANAGIFD